MKKTLFKFVIPVALTALAGAYVWGGVATQPHSVEASMMNAATVTPKVKVVKTATLAAKVTAATKITATIAVSATKGLTLDKEGRPYGGNWPFINYSPTMVTGKTCPRVTKWTLDAQGHPSDPCVIQNAIDDYAEAAYAEININSLDEIQKIASTFGTDPLLSKAYTPLYVRGITTQKVHLISPHFECDQPMARLFVQADKTLTMKEFKPTYALYLQFVRVSNGIQPYSCSIISNETGKRTGGLTVTAKDLAGPNAAGVILAELFYSPQDKRWQINGAFGSRDNEHVDIATLKKLYAGATTNK